MWSPDDPRYGRIPYQISDPMLATLTVLDRVGKSIGVINHICTTFEAQLVESHMADQNMLEPPFGKDLNEVLEAMVFQQFWEEAQSISRMYVSRKSGHS